MPRSISRLLRDFLRDGYGSVNKGEILPTLALGHIPRGFPGFSGDATGAGPYEASAIPPRSTAGGDGVIENNNANMRNATLREAQCEGTIWPSISSWSAYGRGGAQAAVPQGRAT